LEPELGKAKEEVKGLAVDLDDVIIYALYPVTGKKFLNWKYGKEEPPAAVKAKSLAVAKAEQALIKKALAGELVEKTKTVGPDKSENLRTFNVFVGDEYFEVGVDEVGGSPVISYLQQMPSPMQMGPAMQMASPMPMSAPAAAPAAPAAAAAKAPEKAPAPAAVAGTPLKAPMPGMIVSYSKQVGDAVSEGETAVVLEAMKMENALPAPVSGTIKAINFASGDSVAKNDVLLVIE
jgi:oxaloacetate decarboxylase alpha subunit/pyruvate carboxylase subunit B